MNAAVSPFLGMTAVGWGDEPAIVTSPTASRWRKRRSSLIIELQNALAQVRETQLDLFLFALPARR